MIVNKILSATSALHPFSFQFCLQQDSKKKIEIQGKIPQSNQDGKCRTDKNVLHHVWYCNCWFKTSKIHQWIIIELRKWSDDLFHSRYIIELPKTDQYWLNLGLFSWKILKGHSIGFPIFVLVCHYKTPWLGNLCVLLSHSYW